MNSGEPSPNQILLVVGPLVKQEHLIETFEQLKKIAGENGLVVVENFEDLFVSAHARSSFGTVMCGTYAPTLTFHPTEVFGEIVRLLKPGGTLVVREFVAVKDHVPNLRTPSQLMSALVLSGFANVGMPITLPISKSNVEDHEKHFTYDENDISFVEITAFKPFFEIGASDPVPNMRSIAVQPKHFSNDKMSLIARHERQMRENIKATKAFVRLTKQRLEAQRNKEKTKESCDQISSKVERLGNSLNRLKRFMEESGMFLTAKDPHFNQDSSPTELAKSVIDNDPIEERRYHVRREVAVQRRNNQLRAANLNRGLVMDEDCQGASKSDQSFDLTSLDEALPSASHCRRALGLKRRTLKLQDVVMNSVKESRLFRLATAELCSMDSTAQGENS